MDIVKPIPPKSETATMCFQVTVVGKEHRFILTASREKRLIPTNLPTTKPSMMPALLGWSREAYQLLLIVKPVFANAKSGSTKKGTR